MKAGGQIRFWLAGGALMAALLSGPLLGDNRRNDQRPAPHPSRDEARTARPSRNEVPRPQPRNVPQSPRAPQPVPQNRSYRPPSEGHHSGQWLNQHREMPLDQQRRALEDDPQFRKLPPDRQQRLEQRLQRFSNMPPDRQDQVLERMEKWEHLTREQKNEFRAVGSQFSTLPPERRRAVRSAIDRLRAMPPQARQRELQSGRFRDFSPQEQQILNDAARLPLAPSQQNNENEAPQTGPNRYVPRPPQR